MYGLNGSHPLKRLVLAVLLICGLIGVPLALASAPTVVITWNANTEPDLAGYKVYRASTPCSGNPNLLLLKDVGPVTTFTDPAPPSISCYAVSAYDFSGNESGFSNLVGTAFSLTPGAPTAPIFN